jgi:hypothetical protein
LVAACSLQLAQRRHHILALAFSVALAAFLVTAITALVFAC